MSTPPPAASIKINMPKPDVDKKTFAKTSSQVDSLKEAKQKSAELRDLKEVQNNDGDRLTKQGRISLDATLEELGISKN